MPKKPPQINPFAPTVEMPAVQPKKTPVPSSSGEHVAVRELSRELEKLGELSDKMARGESLADEPVPDSPPVTVRPDKIDAETPRQERILVADDDIDIRDVLAHCLRDEGYHVRVAVDGLDALDKMIAHPPPDVILLDIGMPKLDGTQVLKVMRVLEINIPVVVISAGSLELLLKQNPEMVRDFVFPKPLNLAHLLGTLRERINEKRQMPSSGR
jgi:CheY-like chemotaxis protein